MKEHRRYRRSDKFEVVAAILAIVCVLGMSLWIHFQQNTLDKQQRKQNLQQNQIISERHTLGTQYQQLVEACQRLNILRAEDNLSHYADFRVFQVVYVESLQSIKKGLVPPSRRADEDKFLGLLHFALKNKSWTPLTNCTNAVNKAGVRYRPPRPIAFYKHLPKRNDLIYHP